MHDPQNATARLNPRIRHPFYVECRVCGYEPAEQLLLPRMCCPKCACWSWQRVARPGALCPADAPPTRMRMSRRKAVASVGR